MQLTLEQCGFELGRSIYMQGFFDKYMYPIISYKRLKHLQILLYAGAPGTNPSGFIQGQQYVSIQVSSNQTVTVIFRDKVFVTKLKRNKGNDYNKSQDGDLLCGEKRQGLGRGSAGSVSLVVVTSTSLWGKSLNLTVLISVLIYMIVHSHKGKRHQPRNAGSEVMFSVWNARLDLDFIPQIGNL